MKISTLNKIGNVLAVAMFVLMGLAMGAMFMRSLLGFWLFFSTALLMWIVGGAIHLQVRARRDYERRWSR